MKEEIGTMEQLEAEEEVTLRMFGKAIRKHMSLLRVQICSSSEGFVTWNDNASSKR